MANVSQLLESRRSRLGRWAGAAAIVCVLHVGGAALALMRWHEEADDAGASAMTVELAPLPVPVRVDSPDLIHGPDQQEVKPTPQAAEQMVEEIPPVDSSPAPEPEVALPRRQPEEKETRKQEELLQEAALEKERPQPERQTLATAPLRVDAQLTPSSAPSPGESATPARMHATWRTATIRHLEGSRNYPEVARLRGQQGRVVVRFRVDRSGHVISSHIVKGAEARRLDNEALALLVRADPMPTPPDQLPESELELEIPVNLMIK